MRKVLFFAILGVGSILLMGACGVQRNTTPPIVKATATQLPTETQKVIVPSPSPELSVSPTAIPAGITAYQFDVLLDTRKASAQVQETISFDPATNQVTLVVPPNRNAGVFELKSIRWGDDSEILDARLDEEKLTFSLPTGNEERTRQEVILRYNLNLPPGEGPLNNTGRQLNFGDWYPFLPVYNQDAGWLVHPPGSVGEYLVYDLADYAVTLHLAEPNPGWVVAASAPADLLADGWHYSLPSARSFAFSASDQFSLTASYSNGVQIFSYTFPEDFTYGEVPRNAAGDALALYEDLYGKYPHQTLSVVEADFPDGMEYDGLFFLGKSYYQQYRGNPYSYLVAIAAHETAHQWFYGQIGNDPALEPWLDESLATYSELLFYERYFPDTSENWWNFRVERYSPGGYVDGTIYNFSAFRPYVNAVYLRGTKFLRDLRTAIGDEAFFAFLKDYAVSGKAKSPGSVITAADFYSILSDHSTVDLSSLIAEYFQHFSP